MTPDPIPAIRQRVEKATPGPWEYRYATGIKRQAFTRRGDGTLKRIERKDQPVVSLGDDGACGDPECCGYPSYHVECSQEDGEFIAHAREDIPILLTLYDAQQQALLALVEQWRERADSLLAHPKGNDLYLGTRAVAFDECAAQLAALLPPQAEP